MSAAGDPTTAAPVSVSTREVLDRADRLAAAATDGPWLAAEAPAGNQVIIMNATCAWVADCGESRVPEAFADGAFMVEARALLPRLSAFARTVAALMDEYTEGGDGGAVFDPIPQHRLAAAFEQHIGGAP